MVNIIFAFGHKDHGDNLRTGPFPGYKPVGGTAGIYGQREAPRALRAQQGPAERRLGTGCLQLGGFPGRAEQRTAAANATSLGAAAFPRAAGRVDAARSLQALRPTAISPPVVSLLREPPYFGLKSPGPHVAGPEIPVRILASETHLAPESFCVERVFEASQVLSTMPPSMDQLLFRPAFAPRDAPMNRDETRPKGLGTHFWGPEIPLRLYRSESSPRARDCDSAEHAPPVCDVSRHT